MLDVAVQKGALEMCVGATFTCDEEETPWRMIAYKWPNHHTSFTKYQLPCPAKLSPAPSLGLYGIDYSSLCVFTVQRCLSISPLFSVQD